MMRTKVPECIEGQLLQGCRRRCAICYGLHRDSGVKRGQIAHLDRNPNNNAIENLAFLCLEHHDEYDCVPSQSKRYTITEVKAFRAELEESMAAAMATPVVLNAPSMVVTATGPERWVGMYRAELGEARADLEVQEISDDRYSVKGIALFGVSRAFGPHIGQLEAEGRVEGDCLVAVMGDYVLRLLLTAGGAVGEESMPRSLFGMGVSFALPYRKLPRGGDVLPQPERRSFESEFWPKEGVPVFVSRVEILALRARPSSDAPVAVKWPIKVKSPVPFDGFRYRTVRPGILVARREGQLVGRNLGRTDYVSHANYYQDGGEDVTVGFRPGDRLEYLQYRAEGTAFLRWQGLALDAPLPNDTDFEELCLPVAESWVRVTCPSSGAKGWVLADEQLEEVARQF